MSHDAFFTCLEHLQQALGLALFFRKLITNLQTLQNRRRNVMARELSFLCTREKFQREKEERKVAISLIILLIAQYWVEGIPLTA
jgi:hypothetical protein